MCRWRLLLTLALLAITSVPVLADEFYLKGNEKIVFFGDSITQNGGYVTYVEAYLRTRFPEKSFQVINHGISSETISGTSEADHEPRRPDAQRRFARDVAGEQPEVVVACFGMNDGNYHPPGEERFAAYRAGVERLLARCRDEAGNPRVTLLTAPPFDPYYRKVNDPMASSFGYKYASLEYDETLRHFARYLNSLRGPRLIVADCHTAMNAHLRQRRLDRVSWTFAPDAVHPDPTGHLLMALSLLDKWNAPAEVAAASMNAQTLEIESGEIRELKREGDAWHFSWRVGLPMPRDRAWDAESLALEKFTTRFNSLRLVISNLAPGKYELLAGDATLGPFRESELSRGLELSEQADFPPVYRGGEFLKQLQQRSATLYAAWRKSIAAAADDAQARKDWAAAEELAARQDRELRDLCQPMELRLSLRPVK